MISRRIVVIGNNTLRDVAVEGTPAEIRAGRGKQIQEPDHIRHAHGLPDRTRDWTRKASLYMAESVEQWGTPAELAEYGEVTLPSAHQRPADPGERGAPEYGLCSRVA